MSVRKTDGNVGSNQAIQHVVAKAKSDPAWQGEDSSAGGRPQSLLPTEVQALKQLIHDEVVVARVTIPYCRKRLPCLKRVSAEQSATHSTALAWRGASAVIRRRCRGSTGPRAEATATGFCASHAGTWCVGPTSMAHPYILRVPQRGMLTSNARAWGSMCGVWKRARIASRTRTWVRPHTPRRRASRSRYGASSVTAGSSTMSCPKQSPARRK